MRRGYVKWHVSLHPFVRTNHDDIILTPWSSHDGPDRVFYKRPNIYTPVHNNDIILIASMAIRSVHSAVVSMSHEIAIILISDHTKWSFHRDSILCHNARWDCFSGAYSWDLFKTKQHPSIMTSHPMFASSPRYPLPKTVPAPRHHHSRFTSKCKYAVL